MITLKFTNGVPNKSLEVNDLAYYSRKPSGEQVAPLWGENYWTTDQNFVSTHIYMGVVSAIKNNESDGVPGFTVYVEEPFNFTTLAQPPQNGDFIYFAKNSMIELSSMLGYYNQVVLQNNSIEKAELFAVSCEATVSSK